MRRKRIIESVVVTAIVGVAVTITLTQVLGQRKGTARGDDDPAAQIRSIQRVEVSQPVRRPLTRELRMPGTLIPGETADLFAKISGYISSVAVDIGSQVRKRDELLTIDVPEMADELAQAHAVLTAKREMVEALKAKSVKAEAMIATARAEVQRYEAEYDLWRITAERKRQLLAENAISQQDFDEVSGQLAMAKAKLRIAEARVDSAVADKRAVDADVVVAGSQVTVAKTTLARLETLMDYATIRAPFDGVIIDRLVDPGAFVRSAAAGSTTPLLTIANVGYIRLVLEIPESDSPFVQAGTEVVIDVVALRGEPIDATVTRTAASLKADTRTMRVEVDLNNSDGLLAPGLYAQVLVKLEVKEDALVVPASAIRVRGRTISVLIADGSVARRVPVTIGYDDGIWVEVVSGLSGGEQVIVSATSAVVPGAAVQPVPAGGSTG